MGRFNAFFSSTVIVVSSFFATTTNAAQETLSNAIGTCNTTYIGCSDGAGTGGNPNDLVECFSNATLTAPFELAAFTYTIGDDVPAPDSLNLRVYDWSGTGAPGSLLTTIPLSAGDLTTGFHDLQLATPVALPSQNFCVGLYSEPVGDGFRILTTDVGSGYTPGTSWVMAPACGAASFTELGVLGFGNWCVTATIDDAINLEVEATPVPTMSHWGLLLLAGLLALVTVFNFGRRFQ